jgi:hypothetical protein
MQSSSSPKPRVSYRELQADAVSRRRELLCGAAATSDQKLERMADKVVEAASQYVVNSIAPLRARIEMLEERLARLDHA